MTEFTVNSKKITVFPSDKANSPMVYLNMYAEMGEEIYKILRDKNCPDHTLVTVSGLNWDHDMSPWAIPPIAEGDTPCTGGADEYLNLLENEIIPRAEENVQSVLWRGIAGYSLAGLFALYSLYKTDIFAKAASVSGSLWFPKFEEFVFENEMKKRPEFLYFSLGDKECRTKNPYLKTVQSNTENIEEFYRKKGIDTRFKLNPGNHFRDGAERTADGIISLIT